MQSDGLAAFGGNGGIVEVDETFIGNDKRKKKRAGYEHKNKVLGLIDRKTKQSRNIVVDDIRAATLIPILLQNIYSNYRVMIDEAGQYRMLERYFQRHGSVSHNMYP